MNDAKSIDELVLDHLLENRPQPISGAFYRDLKNKYGKEKASSAIRAMEEDGLITPCTTRMLVGYFVTPHHAALTRKGESVAMRWAE